MVQVYVNNIIFGSINHSLVAGFEKLMTSEFEMSMIRELSFFLGLLIVQGDDGIYFYQKKYLNEVVNKYGMDASRSFSTPMSPNTRIDINE